MLRIVLDATSLFAEQLTCRNHVSCTSLQIYSTHFSQTSFLRSRSLGLCKESLPRQFLFAYGCPHELTARASEREKETGRKVRSGKAAICKLQASTRPVKRRTTCQSDTQRLGSHHDLQTISATLTADISMGIEKKGRGRDSLTSSLKSFPS